MHDKNHIQEARLLLAANMSLDLDTDAQAIAFAALGPKALEALSNEGLLSTYDELHDAYVVDKHDLDKAVDDFQDALDNWYCPVGTNYIHRDNAYALSDIVFDQSHDFISNILLIEQFKPSDVIGHLKTFISKQELLDIIQNESRRKASPKLI